MTKFDNFENGQGDDLRTKRHNVKIKFETSWNKILFFKQSVFLKYNLFSLSMPPWFDVLQVVQARPEKTLAQWSHNNLM